MAGKIWANAGTAKKAEGYAGKREKIIVKFRIFVNKPVQLIGGLGTSFYYF